VEATTNVLGSDIASKLSELGPVFNTNPGFGLDGVIKGNEMRALANESTPEVKVLDKVETPTVDDKVFAEVINPLNTSIQATKQELRSSLGQLNSKLDALTSGQRPEVTEEVDPTTNELRNVRTEMAQLRLNSAYDRARNTLNNFKSKHPDFDWDERNIQELWQTRIGNNVQTAETTDWDSYFKMNYDAKRALQQDKLIEELKGKVASIESSRTPGRNSVNDLASVPRSSNTLSTAKPYADDEINEELYQRATARMGKGRFMGWNGILQEEQRKMQLAGKI
jgi:hypothetical protein